MLTFKLKDRVRFKKLDLTGKIIGLPEGKQICYKVKCDNLSIDHIKAYEDEIEPFPVNK